MPESKKNMLEKVILEMEKKIPKTKVKKNLCS